MNNLKTISSLQEIMSFRNNLASNLKVGFVPTMGALHNGHAQLVKKSASENDITVLSIFVNPTQFNNPEDLHKYPKTLTHDLKLASDNGAQIIFTPVFEEIYSDNYRFKLSETSFSKILCGAHRPGHFDGVLTVVMKLLQIITPNAAYFGEKDFQQFQLVKDMSRAFFLKTQIIGCPTVRETDGLAMSSRNVRLTAEGRKMAPMIYSALSEFSDSKAAIAFLNEKGIETEYLEEHFGRRYIAATIDGVRLIDNVAI